MSRVFKLYNHKIRLLLEIRFIGHTKRAQIGHNDERTNIRMYKIGDGVAKGLRAK
jgi:hypothetical protein